jgi:hypothetical protein
LGRWNVSLASTVGGPTVVELVLDVEVDVVVVGGVPDWIASASLLENSSSNQIRF